jgi:chaperonin GroES
MIMASEGNNMITPLKDIVLVVVDKPKQQTASGLYVQEEWKTLPPVGKVVAIGPLVTSVKPGDKILFDRYASIILENDERLCKESHIHGIIVDE